VPLAYLLEYEIIWGVVMSMRLRSDLRITLFAACSIAASLIALPITSILAGEVSSVDGWLRSSSPEACHTTYGAGPPPFLGVDANKGRKTELSLMGLMSPRTIAEADAMTYDGVVTVTLNGSALFAQPAKRRPGSLRFDIDMKKLGSMAAPGQIVFSLKGNAGQQEAVKFASPGLASEVAFLNECLAK
jgi:hypothetical protein